jgi:hypothetical protein
MEAALEVSGFAEGLLPAFSFLVAVWLGCLVGLAGDGVSAAALAVVEQRFFVIFSFVLFAGGVHLFFR